MAATLEARANSVKNYLIQKGISPERLTAVGFGESQPIDTNDTVEGRARNRRTVIRVLKVDLPSRVRHRQETTPTEAPIYQDS